MLNLIGKGLQPLSVNPKRLKASILRDDFTEYVKWAWPIIVPEPLVWNWHMREVCKRLQYHLERVMNGLPCDEDLLINIPPGTSKSLLGSVFPTGWVWTRDPTFKFICASYSHELSLDLSRKARLVVESDQYRELFPEVKLAKDQNTKSLFATIQGGFRYATSLGGSVMGKHAHCFPWETLITTERGQVPIGLLVDKKIKTKVLTINHLTGKLEWKRIVDFQLRKASPLYKIRFRSGRVLECTSDHPIFVIGKGYVEARELTNNDKVLYAKDDEKNNMRAMRLQSVTGCTNESKAAEVLLPQMSWAFHVGGEAPTLQEIQKRVQGLSKGVFSRTVSKEDELVLFDKMPFKWVEGGGKPQMAEANPDYMSFLWKEIPCSSTTKRDMLFPSLCRLPTFLEDEGGGKFQLRGGEVLRDLFQRVFAHASGESPQSGGRSLLRLQSQWETKTFRSSHRQQQEKQPYEQSGCGMPELSFSDARDVKQSFLLGEDIVTSVESEVRIPEAVYNLSVEANHNYFANNVLVHNCIVMDDIVDPKRVASVAELDAANKWVAEEISTRKVNKLTTLTVLIMQRLGVLDPAAMMMQRGNVNKLILPGEDSYPIFPPELKGRYKNGLLDPVRLPRKVLEKMKKQLGKYGYAGQIGQSPLPSEGGLFLTDMFRRYAPYPQCVRFCRFWDKAGTLGAGNYTCGVLIGADKDNRFRVYDMKRFQMDSYSRDEYILATAKEDGPGVMIGLEQEGGSGGKQSVEISIRKLAGFSIRKIKPNRHTAKGGKAGRADPWSVQVNAGNVWVDSGSWNEDFFNEHKYFPFGTFDDIVDSCVGAFTLIAQPMKRRVGGMTPSRKFAGPVFFAGAT